MGSPQRLAVTTISTPSPKLATICRGITGSNAGQIAKEFAKTSGVDTERLDGKSETQRPRVRRRRLLGGEISVPSPPTPGVIKNEWKKLIDDGEIYLGRPCVPYNMVRYATKDGELEKRELTIVGRKFPLLQVRQDLLSMKSLCA